MKFHYYTSAATSSLPRQASHPTWDETTCDRRQQQRALSRSAAYELAHIAKLQLNGDAGVVADAIPCQGQ
jgi:hypothetical protein